MPAGTFWTQESILDAVRAWAREHGEPPTSGTWKRAGYGHPSALTVWRTFPETRFADVIRLAGSEPFRRGPRTFWTRDRVAEALLDHLLREGRWPEQREWAFSSPDHPTAHLIDKLFGNFTNAKLFAGWRPQCPVCHEAFRPAKSSQVYCSNPCCGRAYRRRRAGLPVADAAPTDACSGCGRDRAGDDYTIGCVACSNRKHHRGKRAASKNGTPLSVVESPLTPGDSDPADGNAAQRRPVVLHTEKAA